MVEHVERFGRSCKGELLMKFMTKVRDGLVY